MVTVKQGAVQQKADSLQTKNERGKHEKRKQKEQDDHFLIRPKWARAQVGRRPPMPPSPRQHQALKTKTGQTRTGQSRMWYYHFKQGQSGNGPKWKRSKVELGQSSA